MAEGVKAPQGLSGGKGAEIVVFQSFLSNCVVTASDQSSAVNFYIHKTSHVLGQFPSPAADCIAMFESVVLSALSIADLVDKHGYPHYMKIDIEHYDIEILRALFSAGIFPPYISAESHSIDVFALLVAMGGYNSFKLVDGLSVSKVYSVCLILHSIELEQVKFSFPFHSVGPFGDDVVGPWFTADNFLRVLALDGLGWKDIHASNIEQADPLAWIKGRDFVRHHIGRMTRARLVEIKKGLSKVLRLSLVDSPV